MEQPFLAWADEAKNLDAFCETSDLEREAIRGSSASPRTASGRLWGRHARFQDGFGVRHARLQDGFGVAMHGFRTASGSPCTASGRLRGCHARLQGRHARLRKTANVKPSATRQSQGYSVALRNFARWTQPLLSVSSLRRRKLVPPHSAQIGIRPALTKWVSAPQRSQMSVPGPVTSPA